MKEVDWTKPIRWKENPESKLHFVGFNHKGNAIIDTCRGWDDLVVRQVDGTGFCNGDYTVENIPEKVERWVIGIPESHVYVRWYKSEADALAEIASSFYPKEWSKPVRVEVEMP